MIEKRIVDEPFFSVIVPVYNKEKFVERAISSILNQDCQDFEILIVVDKSTDNSLDVVNALEDPRIKVFTRDMPGPGGYAARNLAISKASGRWVAFLDADDIWLSHHLSSVFDEVQQSPVQLDMVVMGYESDTGKRCSIETFGEIYSSFEMLELFANRDFIHTNSVSVRRGLLGENCLFPEGTARQGGDADTWLRIILNSNYSRVSNKITSFYFSLDGGVISNKSNLGHVHPVYVTVNQVLHTSQSDLEKCRFILMRISNRKNISWLLHKKLANKFGFSDLSFLYIRALTIRDVLKLCLLMIPRRLLTLIM